MRLGDRAKDIYKVFREHTPEIREDQKNVRQGFTVIEQSEIDGRYELENAGDENGWGFWKHGKVENSLIGPKENSRVLYLSEYHKEKEVTNALEDRELGTYFQACPVVMKLDGIYAIKAGDVDNQLESKKIIDMTPESHDSVKNILGYDVAGGITGLLVQSLNQNAHEQYFFPVGNILSVDHSFGGLSSRVADVKENGYVELDYAALDSLLRLAEDENNAKVVGINCSKSGKDITGYGITIFNADGKIIIAYMSKERNGFLHPGGQNDKHKIGDNETTIINPAHIDTNANFYMDETRDGALDFENSNAPGTVEPEADFFAKVHCRWSSSKDKWIWYVGMSTGTEVMICARIHWDIETEQDLSEAEVVEKIEGVWQTTGTLVWIDSQRSLCTDFATGGNNTIFRLKLVEKEITRNGTMRDLYYASYCLEDFGDKISHFSTTFYANSKVRGLLLSESKQDPVWENVNLATIETTINNVAKTNGILANIPEQWKPQAQNFQYLEISGLAKGLKTLFRPIEPVPEDPINQPKVYRSYIEIDEQPIAYYEVE